MNLSLKWLCDYVKCDMPVKEFADGMTMSGSKVEKWKNLSDPLQRVVVGKIIAMEKHTNSDKLWVCHVDVGAAEKIQIVTGAQNVFDGAYVPVVLDGGVVFAKDGITRIKKGRLRGVDSEGMLCSFEELGMEQSDFPYADPAGILIFNNDPDFENIRVGMDVCEFVGLDDVCVEFEITNNRPDCLSVLGLAREAAATFDLPFAPPAPEFSGVNGTAGLSVTVEEPELCSRYMAAVVNNVKIAPSPRWLTERLRACGIRSINNFVDITNYVMLEYGHPMHAFDKRYVSGDTIIIRKARDGEKLKLLDGAQHTLTTDTLVIADKDRPMAAAGVMGGENSGIMPDTTTVVFESACFGGASVRMAAKRLNRRTESSGRFEKDIDPVNAEAALHRALQLVEQLECGEVVRDIIDIRNYDPEPRRIRHDYRKINTIIGANLHEAAQVHILQKLGFAYDDGMLTVPHVRRDIALDCDLAEEVARIHGYNEIPAAVPKLGTQGHQSPDELFQRRIIGLMTAQGCFETLTFSFISPRAYKKAGIEESESVTIRNPLGEDTSVMRRSMLPSMLDILARNYNSRNPAGRFFEIGRVFTPGDTVLPKEEYVLALALYGAEEDFFTLKGIVEELSEKLGLDVRTTALRSNPSYHTGRCAELSVGGEVIGVLGELHPLVLENYGINTRAYAAEISAPRLQKHTGGTAKFRALPRYPSVTRDLSLLCPDEVSSGEIVDVIKKAGKTLLEQVALFDMYKGEQVPEGKKSLSYKLILRKADGTLTDEEADKLIEKVLASLQGLSVHLR